MKEIVAQTFAAFFSTTLDDLLAMVFLFLDRSKDNSLQFTYLKVMLGQFIGFTIIVGFSLIGLVFGTFVPIQYLDLIGLIPFVIGAYKLYESIYDDCGDEKDEEESEAVKETTNLVEKKADPNITEREDDLENGQMAMVDEQNDSNSVKAGDDDESNGLVDVLKPFLKLCLDSLVFDSTILALMCGSDNIVIYTALFATETMKEVVFVIVIFYALLLFNAMIALLIVKSPPVVALFDGYSKYVIAFLLMALGLDILSSSILWP